MSMVESFFRAVGSCGPSEFFWVYGAIVLDDGLGRGLGGRVERMADILRRDDLEEIIVADDRFFYRHALEISVHAVV